MKITIKTFLSILALLFSAKASFPINENMHDLPAINVFANQENALKKYLKKIYFKEKHRERLAAAVRAKRKADEEKAAEAIKRKEAAQAIRHCLQAAALYSPNRLENYQPDAGELSLHEYAELQLSDESETARRNQRQVISRVVSLNHLKELECRTDSGPLYLSYATFRTLLPTWRKPIYVGQELKLHFNAERQIIKIQVAPRGTHYTGDILWLGLNTTNGANYTFQIMDFTHYKQGNRHPKTILCRLLTVPAALLQDPSSQNLQQPPLLTLKGVTLFKEELFYIDAGVFVKTEYLEPEAQKQLKYKVFQAQLDNPDLAVIDEFQYPPRRAYAKIINLKEIFE